MSHAHETSWTTPELPPVERTSIAEVELRQRAEDGLKPGGIVFFDAWPDYGELPITDADAANDPALRVVYRRLAEAYNPDVESYLAVIEDSQDIVMELSDYSWFDKLENYYDNIKQLKDVGSVLHDVNRAKYDEDFQTTLSPARIEQFKAISDVLAEYREKNPDAELLIDQKGSVEGLASFVDFYSAKFNELLGSTDLLEQLESNKKLILDALDSTSVVRGLGGRQNSNRISRAVTETPLIVIDPLSAVMRSNGTEIESSGWMSAENRLCYIDPLTIGSSSRNEAVFNARLLKTTVHEYVHAASAFVYRNNGSSEWGGERIWPEFFMEAMTEKIAYFIAANADPGLFKDASLGSPLTNEVYLREFLSDNPPESLAPQYIQKLKRKVFSSYGKYRVLTDTFMSGIDWESVGLTRAQADKMAVAAFLEVDPEQSSLPNVHRKAFLSALHRATHPGFMVKLGALVNDYGPEVALDLLESPNFDYKNKDDLPWLASPHLRDKLSTAQRRSINVPQMEQRLHLMEQGGSSDDWMHGSQISLEETKLLAHKGDMLDLAKVGLLRTVRSKHGHRKRSLTHDQQKFLKWRSFKPEKSQRQTATYKSGVLRESYKNVAAWRKEQEARRNGDWDTYSSSLSDH